MNKYKYTYILDYKEVDKKTFERALMEYCMKCDTNYKNPLLNICYLDTKKFNKEYRKLKTKEHYTLCVIGLHSYKIKKELK